MASRGRDLKISFLSDVDRFNADKPADQLENLADSADEAARRLEELKKADASRALRDLEDDADRAGDSLDTLGDDAKRTAEKADDAFDKIARSSRQSLRKDLDGDTDKARASLREVGDEAADTGREMAASFSGGIDDIKGAAQELSANAGALFGPVGLIIGGALSAGLAIFTKKSEELKERTAEMVDALIEGGGRIEEESIVAKLRDFARDGSLDEIAKQADAAGVSADLYARALAGDVSAMQEVDEQAARLREELVKQHGTQGRAIEQTNAQARAIAIMRGKMSEANGSIEGARTQWKLLEDATRAGITADIIVNAPSPGELDAINRMIRNGIGTIPVPLRVTGQPATTNNANNSRYRN